MWSSNLGQLLGGFLTFIRCLDRSFFNFSSGFSPFNNYFKSWTIPTVVGRTKWPKSGCSSTLRIMFCYGGEIRLLPSPKLILISLITHSVLTWTLSATDVSTSKPDQSRLCSLKVLCIYNFQRQLHHDPPAFTTGRQILSVIMFQKTVAPQHDSGTFIPYLKPLAHVKQHLGLAGGRLDLLTRIDFRAFGWLLCRFAYRVRSPIQVRQGIDILHCSTLKSRWIWIELERFVLLTPNAKHYLRETILNSPNHPPMCAVFSLNVHTYD